MHWNMACLASALIPLLTLNLSEEEAQTLLKEALDHFPTVYAQEWQSLFRAKLGLSTSEDGDIQLIERLLQAMHDSRVDFTNLFRGLSSISLNSALDTIDLRNDFINQPLIDQWFSDYLLRLRAESSDDVERKHRMSGVNPKYILRNHLAQAAIEKAQNKDFSGVATLLKLLEKPFDEHPAFQEYAIAPPPNLATIEVSCSS
jgi:uncharacterized protein YdiU (UPF0061 family)